MKVTVYRWLPCLVALLAVGSPVFAQAPQPRPTAPAQSASQQPAPRGAASCAPVQVPERGRWWRSDAYQKDLKLTTAQIARFDHIWEDAAPCLTEDGNQLDEREAQLSRLIEMNAEDERITHQIDRVEATRSLLNKDRELMLIHMRQVLTPDQRVTFNQHWLRLREQQQQPQRQGGSGSSARPPQAPGGPQRSTQPPASSASPGKRPE